MTKPGSKSVSVTKPSAVKPRASRSVEGIEGVRSVAFNVVQKAFDIGPIFVQRDHEARAKKVKYINEKLHGDQLIFHMVRLNGVLRLVDGYTRVKRVVMEKVAVPARVYIVIHAEPANETALKALYDQFNSPAARKGATCRFSEGQRVTSTLRAYSSHLVLKLQKSAPATSVGITDIREGVIRAVEGMKWLDSLGLRKGSKVNESLGSVAAYLAIGRYAHRVPVAAEQFVRNLNAAKFTPRTRQDLIIARFRQFHMNKSENGALGCIANVTSILEHALRAFLDYAEISVQGLPAGETLSVEDFGRAMERLPRAA